MRAWACVFFCKCSARSLQTTVPGKQNRLISQVLMNCPGNAEGSRPVAPPSPPSCSCSPGLSVAVPGCAVLVTSSDKLVSAGSRLGPPAWPGGGFWAPGQFLAGHPLLSLSGSLGAALVLGLRYCCFTVKCKLNSDTYAPMLSILRNTNPR